MVFSERGTADPVYVIYFMIVKNLTLLARDVVILVGDGGHEAGLSIDVVANYLEAPVGKPHPFADGLSC